MSAAVKGKTLDDVRRNDRDVQGPHDGTRVRSPTTDDATDATCADSASSPPSAGVVKFPVRIKCATLAWNTLRQGLDETRTRRRATGVQGTGS